MIWRWIVGILVLLLALLCWTRVGALISLGDMTTVDVKAGWLRIRIFPGKAKKPKAPKREKKKSSTEKGTAEKKSSIPKPDLADIQDAVKTLIPPLKKALGRTRRGIRVNPMRISLILGGREDPAAAAKLYGELNAGIWTGMPAAEQLLDIPEPCIHTEVDFDAEKMRIAGTVGVSIRIGTVLVVGFGIAVPVLRWILRYWRKHRMQQPAAKKVDAGAA